MVGIKEREGSASSSVLSKGICPDIGHGRKKEVGYAGNSRYHALDNIQDIILLRFPKTVNPLLILSFQIIQSTFPAALESKMFQGFPNGKISWEFSSPTTIDKRILPVMQKYLPWDQSPAKDVTGVAI
ncbi:hypothetical protein L0P88_01080 [Muricauda sp. SCSIO 64092]|uniref:hypothetical protein n=1 Tax=Allomuricauda sp. SCSIO 64092 TaxID=2908842 RepID=UPI001FF409F2|nr:hypothetical protein [Muricauda sp. SCSIO 64092]UOY07158.1 hypothetical protein L0P88_01080 [Muricauda sp. SCSIO 64092]